MHMDRQSYFSVGSRVSIGDIIGYTGRTGLNATSGRAPDFGAHLHFEIREHNRNDLGLTIASNSWRNARAYDPESILP